MKWFVPPIWENGDAWIIGGGPSLTEQFNIPDDVVAKVRNGELPLSAYSPYMSEIHDCHVIGINVAYLIGNWIDIMFFGDGSFYTRYKKSLVEWPNLKVSCSMSFKDNCFIKYLSMDSLHSRGISSKTNSVSWNHSSGAAAISLAAHLGVKRIMLLGFDMDFNAEGERHWHNSYKRPNMSSKKITPFRKHLEPFSDIAKDALSKGIEILNINPKSKIEAFPKYSLKEYLIKYKNQ